MTRARLLRSLVLAAAVLLLLSGRAEAGTYTVQACGSNGVNNAFWGYANGGLTAYSRCPGIDFDGENTGLVAKGVPGGWVGNGASAWQIFEAPAGARLQSMSFRMSSGRSSGCWSIGVFAWSGDAFHPGEHLWGNGASCSTPAGGFSYYVGPFSIDLRGHQKVRVGVRCDGGACPTGGSQGTFANVKDVGVTVRDDSAPGISPHGGALLSDGWHRGYEEAWGSYADNVGIRNIWGELAGETFSLHDFAGWGPPLGCDFSRPRPCQDIPNGGVGIDTARVADGTHAFRMVAVDAAGNQGSVARTVRVDNHAPEPPRDIGVAGGEGWRRDNGFDVSWANPPGQVAPIVRAHWRLCRAGSSEGCQSGSADGAGIAGLAGLRPAAAGDWLLSAWLEDEAGNASDRLASQSVHLRFDDVAPETAGFDLLDPADPRRVALPVADRHSGVAATTIQIRPRSGGEWRSLATTLESGRAGAHIPDVELPDGTYELRALVRDHAGNETLADRDAQGRAMTLVLPLRVPTRIVAEAAAARPQPICRTVRRRVGRRVVSRRVCRRVPTSPPAASVRTPLRLPFGRAGTLTGVVETWQGRPIGGAVVDAQERLRTKRIWRAAGTVRADTAGRFTHTVAAGASRFVRLSYAGSDLLLPASLEAQVLVPAAGTLRASRRSLRNGGQVVFSGALRGRPFPPGGRTIDLQAFFRGAWRTFATPRTDARGRWRYPYRFGATRGRVVYRFRTLIKRDAAYPYEQGASPAVRVVVTG